MLPSNLEGKKSFVFRMAPSLAINLSTLSKNWQKHINYFFKCVSMSKPLPRSFYCCDTALVAQRLLGKLLLHKDSEGITAGYIVETEAYYGRRDPASRAYIGKRRMNAPMWDPPGHAFIYMVHANWLLNVVTGKPGKPRAVLIRAIEPTKGIDLMRKRRGVHELQKLCNGPGKLTKAMGIDVRLNRVDVCDSRSPLVITKGVDIKKDQIARSHRIGVVRDVRRRLRFYIAGNRFVSRKCEALSSSFSAAFMHCF
jgi:DNA-3-methyladenine glycosylase